MVWHRAGSNMITVAYELQPTQAYISRCRERRWEKKCSIIEIAQLEMPENEEEYDPLTMLWE